MTSRDLPAAKIANRLKKNRADLFAKLQTVAYKGQNYAIWQETFGSELIYGEEFLKQKIDYMHNNPVRRRLVDDAAAWKPSSYRQIEGCKRADKPSEMFIVDEPVSV